MNPVTTTFRPGRWLTANDPPPSFPPSSPSRPVFPCVFEPEHCSSISTSSFPVSFFLVRPLVRFFASFNLHRGSVG